MHLVSVDKLEKDRHRALVSSANDLECDVKSLTKIAGPGSFFCHELMVFMAFLADSTVEQLESPALLVNSNWYARMRSIVESLEALHNDIEIEHITAIDEGE